MNTTTPAHALGDVEVLGKQFIANARPNAAFVRYEDYMSLLAFAESSSARVREAEGLLRHWQAWICGPSELHKATAAFLAASGETK